MLAFLLSKTGLAMIGVALIAGIIGIQTLRLNHAKSDLSAARVSLAASQDRLKASEALRAAEYQKSVSALSDAETVCSARVSEAARSSVKIRTIIQKPVAVDAKNCPQRALVTAGELRDAIQP